MKLTVKPKAEAPFDAVTFGYNSVDFLCVLPRFVRYGEKLHMSNFEMQGGGQCATAAVALARWGYSARYLGRFGGGYIGRFSKESVEREGVDVSCTLSSEQVRNQIAVILIDAKTGERTITYIRDEGLDLKPGEIPAEAACSGRVLLVDAHQIPATVEAASAARESGIPVVIDAEKIFPGTGDLIPLGDYVLCDAVFPSAFTGSGDPEKALARIGKDGAFVSMTLGSEGSLAYYRGDFIRTPGHRVHCADTTGAGDIFHAGFVAGMLMGLEAEACLRLGNVAAALKCRVLGGRPGIPEFEEVLSILREEGTIGG